MRHMIAALLLLPGLAYAQTVPTRPLTGGDILYSLTHPGMTVLPGSVLPNGGVGPAGATGPAGAAGAIGQTGLPGTAGTPGAAGVGISGAVLDGSGRLVLQRTDGSSLPPVVLPAASPASGLPNIVVALDAALPAGTAAAVAGTPGIQVDASGNVIALSSPDGSVYQSGYGRASLVTAGGPAGLPYFHDVAASLNGGFEALNVPLPVAKNLARANQSYTAFFVVRLVAPTDNDLLRFIASNSGFKLHGTNSATATDCALRIEDNRGAATGQEASGPATACGTWLVLEVVARDDDGTLSLLRNGTVTVTTPSGPMNGFTPDVAQIMNKCGCDVAYAEIAQGIGNLDQRNARLAQLAQKFAIAGTTSITFGPAAGIPPAPVQAPDPTIVNMATLLNHPTGPLPNPAGASLGSGLPTTGFTSTIHAVFGTAAGQMDGNAVRAGFEFNYNGASQAQGSPGDTGQAPGNSPFHAVARYYPVGDPNDLLPVMADGLHMRAVCSQAGNTDCSPGHVWGAFIRDSSAAGMFQPGKTVKFRYQSPKGQHSWNPLWLFPPDGGTGGRPVEIDANDNFPRFGDGTTTGYQVDFGTPNIYGAYVSVGTHRTYAAQGAGYKYIQAGPSYYEMPFDWSAGFHDLVLSWDLQSEVLSEFADGKLFAQIYQPFAINCNRDAANACIGLNTLIGNQAIANFTPGSGTAINNDGIADGWTLVLSEYSMFTGALTPAQAQAFAPAGAVNATPVTNINGPTPPSGQHALTANGFGTAATPTTPAMVIGNKPFVVRWTGAFVQADLDQGAMLLGKWGNFTDEMRARVIPGGRMELCWRDGAPAPTVPEYWNGHICIRSSVPYQFQANTFYDLEYDGLPASGSASFYANAAGGARTQLGAAGVATAHLYQFNTDVATYPVSVAEEPQGWHIGQGNNDTIDNAPPPDGRNTLSGTWTKASLAINGVTVLAPVVGTASVADASAGSPAWTVFTPSLGGSAVYDSHTQPGGPAATPPPPATVPAGTEPVVASLGGFGFRAFNLLAGTTITQGTAGSSPVVIAAPAQPAETDQGIMTPVAAGVGTWTAALTGTGATAGGQYASGLLLGAAGQAAFAKFISFDHGANSFTALAQGSSNLGSGDYPFNANGGAYCLRLVRDATNWTALGAAAPCAAGSFVQVAQVALGTLGTVDSIGPFANPNGGTASTAAGGVTMTGWGYVATASPQVAGP